MLAYIPYMDPMGFGMSSSQLTNDFHSFQRGWLKHVETTNQFSSAILMRTKNDVNNGKLLNYQRDPEGTVPRALDGSIENMKQTTWGKSVIHNRS